jgi:hypothetical protein
VSRPGLAKSRVDRVLLSFYPRQFFVLPGSIQLLDSRSTRWVNPKCMSKVFALSSFKFFFFLIIHKNICIETKSTKKKKVQGQRYSASLFLFPSSTTSSLQSSFFINSGIDLLFFPNINSFLLRLQSSVFGLPVSSSVFTVRSSIYNIIFPNPLYFPGPDCPWFEKKLFPFIMFCLMEWLVI